MAALLPAPRPHDPSTAPTRAPSIDVDAFAASLSGTVIRPLDEAYEAARHVHNTLIDRKPFVIVRAADAADVARSVVFARDHELALAVRGGSHSIHGTSDGLVLDLSEMKGLHIDPVRRLAWAQPGLTAGEYTLAAAAHGLATPFGDTASVGIGGLTLGGGIGWLVRKHGLAIDNLVMVEVVTADGRLVTASEDRNPDLFWAVRGGGGNFGVVTRFVFRLHPVGTVLGGALFLPVTRSVLEGLVPVAEAAPEELTTITFIMAAPPLPFVPEEQHFKPTAIVMFVHASDDIAAGQAALEPFRALATPLAEAIFPMPYPGIYDFTAEGGKPGAGVTRSVMLDELDDETIDLILERVAAPSSPTAITEIRVLGGAMARIPADATAFAHRDARILLALITPFEDPAEAPVHEAWTQSYIEEVLPKGRGVYSNFLADEGEERIREAYPAATYERLSEIKRAYDPGNLFRLNQNIVPAPPIARRGYGTL
ncbi:MAG TPA: FAD-binding oxidoreductase [Candidatus Limnocylindrales bacterium]|nr:FAD-binding oxidoreductase [Candidatus Limnocylindrales bacterium]